MQIRHRPKAAVRLTEQLLRRSPYSRRSPQSEAWQSKRYNDLGGISKAHVGPSQENPQHDILIQMDPKFTLRMDDRPKI